MARTSARAVEKNIERVLDLLTTVPERRLDAPAFAPRLGASFARAWPADEVGPGPASRGARTTHALEMRRILKPANVVAVGISEKITRGQRVGKLALTFYVERKLSLQELGAMAVPPTVPGSLSGPESIVTDVKVIGTLRPETNATRKPIQPGNSIGHIGASAGTLGAVVSRNGAFHILSNSHVLALAGLAKRGDSIVYPGIIDGGTMARDLVARLAGFKKFITRDGFHNRVDCAIATPTPERLGDVMSEIKGLGLPRGTIKPVRGMKVTKVGRTTGRTTGEIQDTHFRFTLDYKGEVGEVGFTDQVLCSRYTDDGDSGSLVIDKATGRAVGLHFAGANGGSVFNPIDEVLKALGVTLVTKPMRVPKSRTK